MAIARNAPRSRRLLADPLEVGRARGRGALAAGRGAVGQQADRADPVAGEIQTVDAGSLDARTPVLAADPGAREVALDRERRQSSARVHDISPAWLNEIGELLELALGIIAGAGRAGRDVSHHVNGRTGARGNPRHRRVNREVERAVDPERESRARIR